MEDPKGFKKPFGSLPRQPFGSGLGTLESVSRLSAKVFPLQSIKILLEFLRVDIRASRARQDCLEVRQAQGAAAQQVESRRAGDFLAHPLEEGL